MALELTNWLTWVNNFSEHLFSHGIFFFIVILQGCCAEYLVITFDSFGLPCVLMTGTEFDDKNPCPRRFFSSQEANRPWPQCFLL